MKLSVVIVNYNVKYFIEQCLHSVLTAVEHLDAEVFVVDNNSVDGSVEMIVEKFPQVKLICNSDNPGFSKANNQAIRISKGEYVLLLNPDTLVEQDTLKKCVDFMDAHPDAGGLGIQMIDGKGRFLPESKRGLPTPAVAFYKIFGLSALFPKSKIFGKYHLGFLDKNKTHQVDVLSGAFMMLRKETLDKVGLLDEDFFMYGEDIDLSYRIIKGGYKNYYFPEARIIHYKGESTKKSSINYVFVFYRAMVIFAEKHFSLHNARLFSLLINMAIYLRAGMAVIYRIFKRLILPVSDALLIYGGGLLITAYWGSHVVFNHGGHYPPLFLFGVLPAYIVIWLIAVLLSGGYDVPLRLRRVIMGMFTGTITILVFYALLPAEFRFSRALIILIAIWGLLAITGIRLLLHLSGFSQYRIGANPNRRFAVVGNPAESERVAELLRKSLVNPGFIGIVGLDDKSQDQNGYIGHMANLSTIINIYKIDEVIFCAKDMPAHQIIDAMSHHRQSHTEYKIAPPESMSIIGSNSIRTSRDLYIIDINSISKVNNRRNKRIFDLLSASILLAVSPVAMLITYDPPYFVYNLFRILLGYRSVVGYAPVPYSGTELPPIRKGILYPTDLFPERDIDADTALTLNMLYARDYRLNNDLNILIKGFRRLGRSGKKRS